MTAPRVWTALALASIILSFGCAHAPPGASRDPELWRNPALLLVGRWDGHIPGWQGPTDWTLYVQSVVSTGRDGFWRGEGGFGVTHRGLGRVSLSITAVDRRVHLDFGLADGTVINLWLDGTNVLDGTFSIPGSVKVQGGGDVRLTLWKVEAPSTALTLDQLKALPQYGDAKASLIGTWRGSVEGIADNQRILVIRLVEEVEDRIRIVAEFGRPGRGLGLAPIQFVRAKAGLGVFFLIRADVHVTLWLDSRRGVLEGTFVPWGGAGRPFKIKLTKDPPTADLPAQP